MQYETLHRQRVQDFIGNQHAAPVLLRRCAQEFHSRREVARQSGEAHTLSLTQLGADSRIRSAVAANPARSSSSSCFAARRCPRRARTRHRPLRRAAARSASQTWPKSGDSSGAVVTRRRARRLSARRLIAPACAYQQRSMAHSNRASPRRRRLRRAAARGRTLPAPSRPARLSVHTRHHAAELDGKALLVTGAARRIGASIAPSSATQRALASPSTIITR